MRIHRIGEAKIILSNPHSKHNYFAWPTIAKLQNGKIAVAASGYRLAHVCPFGKTVMAISEDNGETYSAPMPIIDTILDDRDAGLCPFGKSGLILTSFNNTVNQQRDWAKGTSTEAYRNAYLDLIDPEEQKIYHGSTFRVSHDNGVTFGPIYHSPITSPHGPTELSDGAILWVGRTRDFSDEDCIAAYLINPETGEMTFQGKIPPAIAKPGFSCEPHAIELPDGSILCHIRVQERSMGSGYQVFTVYQSVSQDKGKTWTTPQALLDPLGGSPPHLMRHSSGTLICSYAIRKPPYGIRMMFSKDNGKTWDVDHELLEKAPSPDLGYPATIELPDHTLLTVYYGLLGEGKNAVIFQQKWELCE